jgi:hypothetical protein
MGEVFSGMETTFLVLVIYAFLLFIYDYGVAPSLRSGLQSSLMVLFVRQVRLSVEYRDMSAKRDLQLLHDSIRAVDANLGLITLGSVLGLGAASAEDPAFLERAQERVRILNESTVPGVREVFKQIVEIATRAAIINGLSKMALFAAPCVVASIGLDEVKQRIRVMAVLSVEDFQCVAPRPRVSRNFRRLLRR